MEAFEIVYYCVLSSTIVFLFIALVLNMVAVRNTHIRMSIGRRSVEECGGNYYAEIESGRYMAYQAYLKYKKMSTAFSIFTILASMMIISGMFTFFNASMYRFLTTKSIKTFLSGTKMMFISFCFIIGYIITFIALMPTIYAKTASYTSPGSTYAKKMKTTISMYSISLLALIYMCVLLGARGSRMESEVPQMKTFTYTLMLLYVVTMVFSILCIRGYGKLELAAGLYKSKLDALKTAYDAIKSSTSIPDEIKKIFTDAVWNYKTMLKKVGLDPVAAAAAIKAEAAATTTSADMDYLYVPFDNSMIDNARRILEQNKPIRSNYKDEASYNTAYNMYEHRYEYNTYIDNLRQAMFDLQNLTVMEDAVRLNVKYTLFFAIFVIGTMVFKVYHSMYKDNPDRTIVWMSLFILGFVFAASFYGWFASALLF